MLVAENQTRQHVGGDGRDAGPVREKMAGPEQSDEHGDVGQENTGEEPSVYGTEVPTQPSIGA